MDSMYREIAVHLIHLEAPEWTPEFRDRTTCLQLCQADHAGRASADHGGPVERVPVQHLWQRAGGLRSESGWRADDHPSSSCQWLQAGQIAQVRPVDGAGSRQPGRAPCNAQLCCHGWGFHGQQDGNDWGLPERSRAPLRCEPQHKTLYLAYSEEQMVQRMQRLRSSKQLQQLESVYLVMPSSSRPCSRRARVSSCFKDTSVLSNVPMLNLNTAWCATVEENEKIYGSMRDRIGARQRARRGQGHPKTSSLWHGTNPAARCGPS